jgi:hypothetical protein
MEKHGQLQWIHDWLSFSNLYDHPVGVVMTLENSIRNIWDSNLGCDTGYADRYFMIFLSASDQIIV